MSELVSETSNAPCLFGKIGYNIGNLIPFTDGVMMLRISRRVDYATRIVLALALEEDRLTLREVRERMHIPPQFAKQLLSALIEAGIILTKRGPGGGLELARPAEAITLLDILQAIEGPVMISDCIAHPHTCPLSRDCPVRRRWARLQASLIDELRATTMAELAAESRAAANHQPLPIVPAFTIQEPDRESSSRFS